MIFFKELYNWLNFYRRRIVYYNGKLECEKRKKYNIFDYINLAKDIPLYPRSRFLQNNYYGLYRLLYKHYAQILVKDKSFIEHGLFLGNYVDNFSLTNNKINSLLTFGSYRKKIIEKSTKKEVITTGPYIKYAESLLPRNDFIALKEELGKVLLVFPSHSIENFKHKFNIDFFIEEIERIKHIGKFETVIVNMYWLDIQNRGFKKYLNKGYKITTAGHRNDAYFLDRLRSVIELSNHTMSNKFGSHLGYCINLNKPHYLFSQTHSLVVGKEGDSQLSIRESKEAQSKKEEKYFEEYFGSFQDTITPKQKEIVIYYFGD